MIEGKLSDDNKLVFEISFVTDTGETIPVDAVLDTGFTQWLAMNNQDIEAMDWLLISDEAIMQTARGETVFRLYEGNIILDGEQFTIPVLGGDELEEILLGFQWLRTVD